MQLALLSSSTTAIIAGPRHYQWRLPAGCSRRRMGLAAAVAAGNRATPKSLLLAGWSSCQRRWTNIRAAWRGGSLWKGIGHPTRMSRMHGGFTVQQSEERQGTKWSTILKRPRLRTGPATESTWALHATAQDQGDADSELVRDDSFEKVS